MLDAQYCVGSYWPILGLMSDPALADDLRDWRGAYGFSQPEAADRLGVSLRTWQGWEAGREPRYPRLVRLALVAAAEEWLAEDDAEQIAG